MVEHQYIEKNVSIRAGAVALTCLNETAESRVVLMEISEPEWARDRGLKIAVRWRALQVRVCDYFDMVLRRMNHHLGPMNHPGLS